MAIFKNSCLFPNLMRINELVMLYYEKSDGIKLVIGKYCSKTNDMISINSALQITSKKQKNKKLSKLEQNSIYHQKTVKWNDEKIMLDKGFEYNPLRGKTSWGTKNITIYDNIEEIISKIESYKMTHLAEHLKKNNESTNTAYSRSTERQKATNLYD
ncbi:MAG: hypothetical protein ACP5NV_05800 [Candidatus Woesearchaeota archaeon]